MGIIRTEYGLVYAKDESSTVIGNVVTSRLGLKHPDLIALF